MILGAVRTVIWDDHRGRARAPWRIALPVGSPHHAIAGGLALSAVFFGVGHGAQAAHPAFLLTWIMAGVVFGMLYLLSGNLALPIGAHASVNIAYQALFVRTDLAGVEDFSAIVRIEVDQTTALLLVGFGGVAEATAFILVGILSGLWLWYSRGTPSIRLSLL